MFHYYATLGDLISRILIHNLCGRTNYLHYLNGLSKHGIADILMSELP